MWMTSCTGSTRGGFCGFEKIQLNWELVTEREGSTFGGRRGQTNLRATGAARDGGLGRWKSQNRKNVYLSPYVEEPLNSKVIKSFVPELRSRKCFSCFGFPMFYVYMLWTFYVRFTYPCLAMAYKGSVQWLEDLEIRRWMETIQNTALLRSARILRRVLETWGDFVVTQTPMKNHQPTLVITIIIKTTGHC